MKVCKSKLQIEDKDVCIVVLVVMLFEDCVGLLVVVVDVVVVVYDVVFNCVDLVVDVVGECYVVVVWKFNGGMFFGCVGDQDVVERVIECYCCVMLGVVLMWGQEGDFLVFVDGMCVWVEVESGYGGLIMVYFQFYVVDLDGFFIFEMGYWFYYDYVCGGMMVDQVVDGVLCVLLCLYCWYLDVCDQDCFVDELLLVWFVGIMLLLCCVWVVVEDWWKLDELLLGFVWVDVVLLVYQVFIVCKWVVSVKVKFVVVCVKVQELVGQCRELVILVKLELELVKDEDVLVWLVMFFFGLWCEIVSVYYLVFVKEIGKYVIIMKISFEM